VACCGRPGRLEQTGLARRQVGRSMSERRRSLPIIEADDFARRFSLRGSSLMWFLGAGASAAAGVPTAYDMIWEFKQKLYASQRRISLETVSDLSSPIVRQRLRTTLTPPSPSPRTIPPSTPPSLRQPFRPRLIVARTLMPRSRGPVRRSGILLSALSCARAVCESHGRPTSIH
jgi:hypothetical protein